MALTKKDLSEIKFLIEITLETKLDQMLEEKLDEKLKNILTKDDFFSRMDQIMGELKTMREEHNILSARVYEHEDRLQVVERSLNVSA